MSNASSLSAGRVAPNDANGNLTHDARLPRDACTRGSRESAHRVGHGSDLRARRNAPADRRRSPARTRRGTAVRPLRPSRRGHDELVSRHADARTTLTAAEGDEAEAKSAAVHAEEWSRQVGRANEIWRKRTEEQARRRANEEAAADATRVHGSSKAALQSCEETVRVREKDHQESAKGMADIQAGLERLHSRASRYRAVRAALRRARVLLPQVEFADADAGAVLDRCQREASEASARLVAATARLDTAEQAERAFREVHGGLLRIAERPLADSEAHAVALEALRDLRAEDAACERLPSLRAEKETAAVLAIRQEAARKRRARGDGTIRDVGCQEDRRDAPPPWATQRSQVGA